MILFNLSGHGLIDMSAYQQYLQGNLQDYKVKQEEIDRNISQLEKII